MPETTKKPIKIVPNTIKTIPKIKPATIIPKKTLEEQLEEIYDDIDVNVDDLPNELLEVYEELEGDYKEKSIQKNWKLWLSMFTPFILPAFIKGISGQVTLPYDARQSVQSNAPEPKVVVDHAKRYFESRGLELVKTLSKTDCERLKVQLKDNWGKGPDAFKKSFQEDYANTEARLDSIYRTEYVTAQNEGILARSRDAGHKMKQWNAALDERTCPVCGDQLHGTIIPIEEQFSFVLESKNGSEEVVKNAPPAHVNCRCVLTTLNEEDYDEIKEDSAYISDAFETIKLNYNCPDSEKTGSGPGSCGGSGNSSNPEKSDYAKAKERSVRLGTKQEVFKGFPAVKVDNDFSDLELAMVAKQLDKVPPEIKSLMNIPGHDLTLHKIDDVSKDYAGNYTTGHIQVIPNFSWVMHHEIGHLVDNELWQLSDDDAYVRAMKDDKKFVTPKAKFGPKDYYHTPSEDFAEAISMYINNKDKFKKIFPNRYELISTRLEHENDKLKEKQKQSMLYLSDVANFIKLNYNCPDSEKNGTGPGSCGGNKPDNNKNNNNQEPE